MRNVIFRALCTRSSQQKFHFKIYNNLCITLNACLSICQSDYNANMLNVNMKVVFHYLYLIYIYIQINVTAMHMCHRYRKI